LVETMVGVKGPYLTAASKADSMENYAAGEMASKQVDGKVEKKASEEVVYSVGCLAEWVSSKALSWVASWARQMAASSDIATGCGSVEWMAVCTGRSLRRLVRRMILHWLSGWRSPWLS
jgi:hypothetical protein